MMWRRFCALVSSLPPEGAFARRLAEGKGDPTYDPDWYSNELDRIQGKEGVPRRRVTMDEFMRGAG